LQDHDALSAALEPTFRSQDIQKLGLELMSDLRKLAASYAQVAAFSEASCCLDLRNLWMLCSDANESQRPKARNNVGLSFLTDRLLGKPLDKAMQVLSSRPCKLLHIVATVVECAISCKSMQGMCWHSDPLHFCRRPKYLRISGIREHFLPR
jgi:hypothetical protein